MTTHVERSIEVDVPVRTAYDQWTQFEDFPRFMGGIQQVRQVGDTLTHWVAEIAGVRREWDAEILEQVPDQKVAWAATTGATNAGTVYFDAVGAERTRVRLTLDYEPEGILEKIGDVLDVVERQAVADLDRFKQFIEARGSATGGWRGNVDDTGAPLVGADAAAAGGVAPADVAAAGTHHDTGAGEAGVPGDVVAVGPTGDTRSTLDTDAGPSRTGSAPDVPDLGHSGDPVVVDAQTTGHASTDDAARTGTAAGAATSAGVTGFGTDTGLSSSPTSGVLTGDPGARAASHAGTGTGDLVGEDRDAGAGTNPSGDSGLGERSDAPITDGQSVVQRDFADENLTTDDVVARDFANRDVLGGGVVERDFAGREITERDIANRGIEDREIQDREIQDREIVTGMGGAHGAPNPQPTTLDAADGPGTADDPDNPTRRNV